MVLIKKRVILSIKKVYRSKKL